MTLKHSIALVLGVASFAVFSQSSNPFIGNWRVTANVLGRSLEAKLVIDGAGGSWQTMTSTSKTKPCVGLKVPISVDSVTETEMKITLKFSIIQGCKDSELQLTRGESGSITGLRSGVNLQLAKD